MRLPLWIAARLIGERATDGGAEVTVSLAICRNCGMPKATSNPCGLDHLAAVMEFGEYLDART